MNGVATVLSAARLGWQLLARIPWLSGWLLGQVFPASKCKTLLQVDVSGNHSCFELLSTRPSHALVHLEVRVYNALPFTVELDVSRLQGGIDSSNLLDTALNTKLAVPAAGFGRIVLPEITLTNQQTNWICNLSREYTRVQLTLHWRCKSTIHNWDDSGTYEFPVFIRADRTTEIWRNNTQGRNP
ncbi:MAG: hypothetical protein RQ757_10545 [Pseudomonadales bacterium]|nr:hypothetical protein [Pseudomonadales bacterium]